MMSSGVSPVNSTSYTPRGIISIYLGLGHQDDKLNRVIPNDKTAESKFNLPYTVIFCTHEVIPFDQKMAAFRKEQIQPAYKVWN